MNKQLQLRLISWFIFLFTTGMINACGGKTKQPISGIDKEEIKPKTEEAISLPDSLQTKEEENPAFDSNIHKAWLGDRITKDFLMGKVKRTQDTLFVKVGEEHTERNIYLLQPVYEAYKKMHEAAQADGVRLLITSGHRTFVEQVCEWELRWNNPRTTEPFPSDVEKARFVLQYRSMPGTSRHHWGTDIDLNSFKPAYFETEEGKKMYHWLQKNAHTYGFYQPYTAFNEKRPVGYNEEKWHWSFFPIADIMLIAYLEQIHKEDIRGFKGDQTVKSLPVIKDWVCGISPL
ncbi:D-alanyl-D-alanine carboxypeptidase family protein [Parabacteroides sp. 52]|uniref:M15 family metallopeptidase n=1 Tax=unclassified Parabacteroides TaxID=2649774 RepID=UPI0013D2A500|nr:MULTISPECIES: M15 family metallopeptidase [unclassified Parabacteroides]MDH6534379.1 D-alanyl-D-alanine carboxypeptidase [Parabacteroides sp. PM5-20]NDV54877.1 D-alanyl-D-alanine carboxypeptidase family protein [Parabacteroides sp. 52]